MTKTGTGRISALLVAAALIFALLPGTALAAEYTLSDNGELHTSVPLVYKYTGTGSIILTVNDDNSVTFAPGVGGASGTLTISNIPEREIKILGEFWSPAGEQGNVVFGIEGTQLSLKSGTVENHTGEALKVNGATVTLSGAVVTASEGSAATVKGNATITGSNGTFTIQSPNDDHQTTASLGSSGTVTALTQDGVKVEPDLADSTQKFGLDFITKVTARTMLRS